MNINHKLCRLKVTLNTNVIKNIDCSDYYQMIEELDKIDMDEIREVDIKTYEEKHKHS